MIDPSTLPGIDRFGLRRIKRALSPGAVAGALLGLLLARPLGRLATVLSSVVRQHFGLWASHVAWYGGWLIASYIGLYIIAHWADIDDEETESEGITAAQ